VNQRIADKSYPFQQSSKEIRNEECIGKNKRPKSDSLEIDCNLSFYFYFANTKYLIFNHLFFYLRFIIILDFLFWDPTLILESFLHNLNNSKTNDDKDKYQK